MGSERDFRSFEGPLVIFPNGAVMVKDDVMVSFGVNDENCGWVKIPRKEMEERLEEI